MRFYYCGLLSFSEVKVTQRAYQVVSRSYEEFRELVPPDFQVSFSELPKETN